MKSITPENQRHVSSEKERLCGRENRKSDTVSAFHDSLQLTIERMNDISMRAEAALRSLRGTNQDGFQSIMEHACSIHQRMMQEQQNLTILYQKMKNDKKSGNEKKHKK